MKEKIFKLIKENIRFIITLVLIVAIFMIELPFKIYTPGGMIDLNERVSVDDGFKSEGTLGMAYVSVVRGSLPYITLSFFIPNWDIVPDDNLKNKNETMEERMKIDKLSTEQSIGSAILAAYKLAGKEASITDIHSYISYIDDKSETNVFLLDELLEVDGVKVSGFDELKEKVEAHHEGDEVKLKVKRNDKEIDCFARVFLVEGVPKIGMSVVDVYDYEEDPHANITMKSSESGPSGGLMMALAVYNNLVEEDITYGYKIIGTGTIDKDGNVGAIGGVKYKLLGAVKKKAQAFIVPKANYEEAMNIKKEKKLDIAILSVKTLEDAIDQLSVLNKQKTDDNMGV